MQFFGVKSLNNLWFHIVLPDFPKNQQSEVDHKIERMRQQFEYDYHAEWEFES